MIHNINSNYTRPACGNVALPPKHSKSVQACAKHEFKLVPILSDKGQVLGRMQGYSTMVLKQLPIGYLWGNLTNLNTCVFWAPKTARPQAFCYGKHLL